jgi:hypothetical protein
MGEIAGTTFGEATLQVRWGVTLVSVKDIKRPLLVAKATEQLYHIQELP